MMTTLALLLFLRLASFNSMPNDLTEFLAQEESSGGKNPKALVPDQDKALGKYQITPSMYAEIQKMFPEFANIPFERAALEGGLDLKAAEAGIQVVMRQIASELNAAPTPALIATVWQQGIGNMKKAFKKAKATGNTITPYLGEIGQRRFERATAALPSPQG